VIFDFLKSHPIMTEEVNSIPWIWATIDNPRQPEQFCLEGDLQKELYPETRVVSSIPGVISKQLQHAHKRTSVMPEFRKTYEWEFLRYTESVAVKRTDI